MLGPRFGVRKLGVGVNAKVKGNKQVDGED